MKKTLFALVLCLLALGTVAYAFDGSGTVSDPYVLYDADDFLSMASLVNAGTDGYDTAHYALWADVDFTGVSYVMPGTAAHPFKGSFDGRGYALCGIRITGISGAYQSQNALAAGAFAYAENAFIHDLRVENFSFGVAANSIPVPLQAGFVVGSFVQTDETKATGLARCGASGSLATVYNGADVSVGGLCGFARTTAKNGLFAVSDCFSHASLSLTGKSNVYGGGLFGRIEATGVSALFNVENCYFDGGVRVNDGAALVCVGGIAGMAVVDNEYGVWASLSAVNTVIENCFCGGTLVSSGKWLYRASIVGYATDAAAENCFASADAYVLSSGYGVGGTKMTASADGAFFENTLGFDFGTVWKAGDPHPDFKTSHAPGYRVKDGCLLVSFGETACGAVVTAFYGASGRLLDAGLTLCGENGARTAVRPVPTGADAVAVFFLENETALSPVCGPLRGDIR